MATMRDWIPVQTSNPWGKEISREEPTRLLNQTSLVPSALRTPVISPTSFLANSQLVLVMQNSI